MQALDQIQTHSPQYESDAHNISLAFQAFIRRAMFSSRKFTLFSFGYHYKFMNSLSLKGNLVFQRDRIFFLMHNIGSDQYNSTQNSTQYKLYILGMYFYLLNFKNCVIYILWKHVFALKGKVKVKIAQSCLTLCEPMDCKEFSRQEYWSTQPFPSPGDLPNPGIKPRCPTLHADSLLAELPGKPKNTGVNSLFLIQGIFPTQESNRSFLHCRRILYQLSYQGHFERNMKLKDKTKKQTNKKNT